MSPKKQFDPTLYAIADASAMPASEAPSLVESAVAGGVTAVQIRAKELDGPEFLAFARGIVEVAKRRGVAAILNDRADLVDDLAADGVHLGVGDLSVPEARALLGGIAIIGATAHGMEEVRAAADSGADYVGFGSIFPSPTKRVETIQGVDGIERARKLTRLRIVAIGGITVERAAAVIAAGVDGIAVISGLWSAADVESRAREYRDAIELGRFRT